MVDAKTQALMRSAAQSFFQDTCTISTRTETTTSGVTKPSYGTPVSHECQWLADESGVELVDGTVRPVAVSQATVLFPHGTTVSAKSLVTYSGRTWDVVSVAPNDALIPYTSIRVKETK